MPGTSEKLPNTRTTKPYASMSYQVSPGVIGDRPNEGQTPKQGKHAWYKNLAYGTNSSLNPFFYGFTALHKPIQKTYQTDAISANAQLSSTHFEKR
mgnify:CR=1 FL=1|tara:strand:+ start:403 stop:690 length:288 start_codon:yes stop_codon:yes gene_type:complete